MTIPDSVTCIEDFAFADCTGLTLITIPAGVTSIDRDTFYNCTGLKDVFYGGTEAEWSSIPVDWGNDPLRNAKMHFSEAEPTVALSEDAKTATVTGDFSGLYARVALALDHNGESGLYVTQCAVNADGTILIPKFVVPGLTVKGVNVSLVPTLADIRSFTPNVKAMASKML